MSAKSPDIVWPGLLEVLLGLGGLLVTCSGVFIHRPNSQDPTQGSPFLP